MPGYNHPQTPVGDCRAGWRRAVRRGAAVLLAVVVAASGCGGDAASDEDGGQAQDLESLPEDAGDARESQEGPEEQQGQDAVVADGSLWPHCADYAAVLDALDAEAAGAASGDAVRGFESSADAAVASAEALAADTSASDEARAAGRRAVEAFAAADDAARFAAYGSEAAVAPETPVYSAAYDSALVAAWWGPGTDPSDASFFEAASRAAEAEIAASEDAVSEVRVRAEQADSDLEAALEAADAAAERAGEAEEAARAAAEEAAVLGQAADLEAAAVEAFAAISAAAQGAAYWAAHEAAFNDFTDYHGNAWEGARKAAGTIAWVAAGDAAVAVRAALVARLGVLAEHDRSVAADMTAAHEADLSAWVDGWSRAELTDWERRIGAHQRSTMEEYDRAAEFVFDRQAIYDDAAYRATARAVRVAVAESVPALESVAAAEAEDAHWAEGGSAHRAFVAARDLIASARSGHRGRIHPGTDGIASNAYGVAVDILVAAALAEAADIRADAASAAAVTIEAEASAVEARAAAEQSDAAVAEAQTAAAEAQDYLRAAEAELAEARAVVDAARPDHDLALRAAWQAVAAEVGCR